MTRKTDSPKKGYDYFRERALDSREFTMKQLIAATGWSASSITTYLSKQWKGLVERAPGGFRARREFLRLEKQEFLDHVTQNRPIFGEYKRVFHEHQVTFEFLLPLTRETQLRRALDQLFFRDTIEQRLQEIGLVELESILVRKSSETDDDFIGRLVEMAGMFGGYSISHVSGRFRAQDLMSRKEAGLGINGDYLVDETTAVVRFIIPCSTGTGGFDDALYSLSNFGISSSTPKDLLTDSELTAEVEKIRKLFFALFAETVVRTVRGEDEIWLIEGGVHQRLYRWSQVG